MYSPDYCYRLLNYTYPNEWIAEMRNKEETGMFGFTTGLSFKKAITRKFALEIGIQYVLRGEKTKPVKLNWQGNVNEEYPEKSITKFKYRYVEFPIKGNYLFRIRNLQCFVSAGISINIFTKKTSVVIVEYTNDRKTKSKSDLNIGQSKFNMAGVIGFGVQYAFNEKISVSLEPVYRQFFTSIVAGQTAKEYPFSIGANVGIYYTFVKKRASSGKAGQP